MKIPKYLYLEVTPDKYALPVHVCDSVKELSIESGVSVDNINSTLHRQRHGMANRTRFIEVLANPNGTEFTSEKVRYNVYRRIGGGTSYILIMKNKMLYRVAHITKLTPRDILKAEAFNDGFIKNYKIEKVVNE